MNTLNTFAATCRCVRNAIADAIREGYCDGKTPGELADDVLAFGGHDQNVTHPVTNCLCARCLGDITARMVSEGTL